MTLRRFALTAVGPAAAIALAACAPMAQEERAPDDIPPAQIVGEPVSCIQTNQIRSTRVHGDETIDFEMIGDTVYRNTLPNRCFSLGFEERFSYRTSTGQLCSTDIITVLHSDGVRGAGCGLGEFVPVKLTEPAAPTEPQGE